MGRTVFRALAPALRAADDALVSAFDPSMKAGEETADRHLAYRVGCTNCCIGPFDITPLYAARLLRRLATLGPQCPAAAAEGPTADAIVAAVLSLPGSVSQ